MKKLFCILLAAVFVCLCFSGCDAGKKGKLRICFDTGNAYDVYADKSQQEEAAEKFLSWLDDCANYMDYGISSEDVELSAVMEDVQKEMLNSCPGIDPEKDRYLYASPLFIEGEISDERLAEIVHTHYQKMERMLDES